MGYKVLEADHLCDIWESLFAKFTHVSLADVATVLAKEGAVTHTGRPPTRQAVHYAMSHCERGRKLLERKKRLLR